MALWFWIIVLIIAAILLVSVLGVVFAVSGGIIGFFVIKFIVESLYRKEFENNNLSTFDSGMQSIFRLSDFFRKFKMKDSVCCNTNEVLNITKLVKDRELADLFCYIHLIGCELVIKPVMAELADNPEENAEFLESKHSILLLNKKRSVQELEDIANYTNGGYGANPFILREVNSYQSYNLYEDFLKSCTEYGVSVNLHTNIYNLLLSLKRKNLHFELTKDGYVEYNFSDELDQQSKNKIVKWEKIIFSPDISSENFMLCLRCIFSTHRVYSIEHPQYSKLVDFSDWKTQYPYMKSDFEKRRLLQQHNEYLFLGLFLMRYRLTISDENYADEYLVKDLKSLKRYTLESETEINLNNLPFHVLKLSNVCRIINVNKTDDSLVSEDKNYLPIIFSEDILSNTPTLKYYTSKYTNERDLVVKNDIVISAKDYSIITIWKGELSHPSNEILVLKGIGTDLLQPYLFVYLSSIFKFYYSLGLTKIANDYLLGDLYVLIPPKQIQRLIVEKTKNDQHFDTLTYLEKLYPGFSSIMENIEKLYSIKNRLY